MKNQFLCACMAFMLTVSVFPQSVRLSAAELWNSQGVSASSDKSSRPTYFNKQKDSGGSSRTLYNTYGNKESGEKSSNGGIEAIVVTKTYKKIEMSKQTPSKLWSFMSADAAYNRQSDIDNALQNEYENRVNAEKNIIKVRKEFAAYVAKSAKENQRERAEMQAAKEAKALEKQRKKDIALGQISGSYTSSGKTTGKVVTKGYVTKTDIKTPTRLFNDPNK